MPNFSFTTSPADIAKNALSHGMKKEERSKWIGEFMHNADALRFANTAADPQMIGEVLKTRAWEIQESYMEDRKPLFYLDMFADMGLLRPIREGLRGELIEVIRSTSGDIRYISDKAVDLPTGGKNKSDYKLNQYKYFAGSVEIGLLEQAAAALEGRDIFGEQMTIKMRSIDEFHDNAIGQGAPLHGIYGLASHPDITTETLGTGDWTNPARTNSEILADINQIVEAPRLGSKYNINANMVLMADLRYRYLASRETSPEGRTIYDQVTANFSRLEWADPDIFTPFVPFDAAGPGDTPLILSGLLDRETISFPFLPVQILPVERHGMGYRVGMYSGHGSVNIRRENRFTYFTGA